MNESDKKPFLDALIAIGDIYDKSESDIRKKSPLYWLALQHHSLDSILHALNEHVRDSDRGRFFPKPADIEDKMPNGRAAWPTPDEAWAMCPKDEYTSSAMCDEMAAAYAVAQELVDDGDMVAARMAFISAYKREIDMAVSVGSGPRWFASYGMDKNQRQHADREIVRMKNMALPPSERMKIPDLRSEDIVSLEYLSEKAAEHVTNPDDARKKIAKIKEMLNGG